MDKYDNFIFDLYGTLIDVATDEHAAQTSYTLPEIKAFRLDEMVDDFLMSGDEGCMKPDKAFFDLLRHRHRQPVEDGSSLC